MYEVGDIVGGFGDQYGVTLHTVSSVDASKVAITMDFYPPNDPDFNWAVEELQKLEPHHDL